MDLVQPTTWPEALAARAERPDLLPIAGGTDVMVDLNFDRRRPEGLLDLTRIDEIASWSIDGDVVRLGAGVTYAQVEADLSAEDITISGDFKGKISCRRRLEVTSTGKIQGQVQTALLVVQEGGALDGELHMRGDQAEATEGQ